MQNFDSILETSSKTRKSKEEIRKELKDSIITGERHENKELEEKASKVKNIEDAAAVIREFEEIIKTKKEHHRVSIPTRRSFRKIQEKCKVY